MLLRKIFITIFLFMVVFLSGEVMRVNLTSTSVIFDKNTPTIQGFNKLQIPGTPILPAKSTILALPPGSKIISIDISYGPAELLRNEGLTTAPPHLPTCLDEEVTKQALKRYERNKQFLQTCGKSFPEKAVYCSKISRFRNIPFIRISYFPLLYSKDNLFFYPSCYITIHYTSEETNNNVPKWAYKNASNLFSNWDDIQGYYTTTRDDSFDYVIITYDSLFAAFDSLVAWKDSIGFHTKFVSYDSIVDQYPGTDNADKIRNFLIDKYIPWGIHYVLIGGNVNKIPMKICYPDPGHGGYSYTPTDYYFAELTDDWDADADGYYGEYDQDSIGFVPEVIVGRFPYNDNNTLKSISQKTVNFERDTGTWKNRALLVASFNNFENENYTGWPSCDGAELMETMKDSMLDGWEYTRLYEQAGLCPSIYSCEQALTQTNLVAEWSTGNYAVTNWSGHGNANGAYRKYWSYDDGDGVPEGFEMNSPQFIYISDAPSLDNTHPSIVFAASCSNAGGNNNLARSLIANGASGIVAATTYGWYTPGWDDPSDGDVMSLDYYFYYYLIGEGKKVGDALFDAKMYYFNYLYFPDPWYPDPEWTPQQNMLDYTLFGDPALVREGVTPGVADTPIHDIGISTIQFYPNPVNARGTITYSIPLDGTVNITLFNVAGQRISNLYSGYKDAGQHTISLGTLNLSSGVYFIKIEAEDTNQKMTRQEKIIVF